ncbi:MAG: DUF4214 domain-containing protein [Clostridia bacterium]|nr:DUF4214 domain-containing protein [Clostridia bacterium]
MKKYINKIAGIMAAALTLGCGLMATGPFVNAAGVALDSNNFPDEEFRGYVETHFDSNSDGMLSETELNAVEVIECGDSFSADKVHSLTGIEFFTNLEELYVSDVNLSGVDLSKNVKLTNLFLSNVNLSSIDVTQNTELLNLSASENQLTSIDLSNCPKLMSLSLGSNQLTSLELGNNKELESLSCFANKLTSIDISGCSKLVVLDVENNNLSILNTNYNPELVYIYCSNNKIEELDLSNNTKLEEVNCSFSKIKKLDVSNCTNLTDLSCNTNELDSLDITSCTNLEFLSCYANNLTSLDISNNPRLIGISADNNPFAFIDLTGHRKLIDTYLNPDVSKVYTYELKGEEVKYHFIGKAFEDNSYFLELSIGTQIVTDGNVVQAPTAQIGSIPPPYEPELPDMSAGDFVKRCYSVALGREADEEGFRYWLDSLNSGSACGAQVGYGFIFSSEYISKNRTNDEFVTDLYSMYFGRTPDSEGFKYWVDKLNAGESREEIFAGFANSTEFDNLCKKYSVVTGTYVTGVDNNVQGGINCFVARLYNVFLYRMPDQGGQTGWVKKLIDGEVTGTSCAYGFVFSPEFIGAHPEYEAFVACMYRGFFGREPDQAGFEAWVTRLNTDATYKDVFDGFAGSAEFANLCASYGINP